MHIEVMGRGEPLVMLHGWGMHGGIWSEAAAKLAGHFEVHVVDLPGHGASKLAGEFTLDALVDELSSRFTQAVNLLGWSLGGQVALHWALRAPDKIKKLILVATTPCFTRRADWAFGLPREVLETFAAELEQDQAATLRRFIALQLRGSAHERALLSALREKLFSRGEPDKAALRAGLAILRDIDQRGELAAIRQQTLVIAGQRDRLTPPEASGYLAQALPDARVVEIEGAAHAPFLSHLDIFVAEAIKFLKNTATENTGYTEKCKAEQRSSL